MTEKQIEKHRAALISEKRLYGEFDDSAGRRYYISDLYMWIADYKGGIIYKKWFDKNFPEDIGEALLSLNWSIAYFGVGQIRETKIYMVNPAF